MRASERASRDAHILLAVPTLSGRVAVSGLGASRVPVRIETVDGALVELTTADADGSWSVEVPAGEYVVAARGFTPENVFTDGVGSGWVSDGTVSSDVVNPVGVSAALARRRDKRSEE